VNSEWEPIEGETPIDPSSLRMKSITTRRELLPHEAENIRKATVKYLASRPSAKLAPFDYAWLLKLHKEMFGDVWEWAGKPRKHDVSLGVSWTRIGQDLGGLVLDIQAFPTEEGSLLGNAVLIHHRAVRIHPFANGNGRWARMLANIWLRRDGKAAIEWPEAAVGEEASPIRSEYIAAIQAADDHDLRPLMELHEQFWPEA